MTLLSPLFPLASVASMQQEMDRLFQQMEQHALSPLETPDFANLFQGQDVFTSTLPKVDVHDGPNQVSVKAALPAELDPKGITVEVQGDILTLQGKNKNETENRGQNYYRKEFSQQNFSRQLQLPADVDAQRAQARFEDGTLVVTFPKRHQRSTTTIPVQA